MMWLHIKVTKIDTKIADEEQAFLAREMHSLSRFWNLYPHPTFYSSPPKYNMPSTSYNLAFPI